MGEKYQLCGLLPLCCLYMFSCGSNLRIHFSSVTSYCVTHIISEKSLYGRIVESGFMCVNFPSLCSSERDTVGQDNGEKNNLYCRYFYISVEVCAPGGQERARRSQRVDKE